MTSTGQSAIGTVASLLRYPVKSMLGEQLTTAQVIEAGLLGDRAFALVDKDTGRVASAKNPRKWAGLLECRAGYLEPPTVGSPLPPVRMTLGDGQVVTSTQSDRDDVLTSSLGRATTLINSAPQSAQLEEYWPELEGLEPLGEPVANSDQETITALPVAFSAPAGSLFDFAVVHLVTTASLARLRDLYPGGRFEVRRFRPNIVVNTDPLDRDFVENGWVDRVVAIGELVRLRIMVPTPRCVMTSLAQGDLPRDIGILRTAARYNQVAVGDLGAMACVGVYAEVVVPGVIRCGDDVRLE